ncbi:major facilitator superfamily domain-containing protein [Calycina marina]|uniref:Major facilitator superfamily domain-containing protein n=1 Tax=Calycina marina TaxID=1763456 RepID=A0A9P8CE00_9HELO|nr:major facilitator superfamily domain-containing protein [Calycina marina]
MSMGAVDEEKRDHAIPQVVEQPKSVEEEAGLDRGVRKDVEKGEESVDILKAGNGVDGDELELVTWDGDDDPKDPYNWPSHRKLIMAAIISLGGLVLTMSASMMAPALPQIGRDLGTKSSETQLTMSVYFLALAFGPMIIAPFSEMYGRKKVWIVCSLWYILFNALCPVGNSKGLMIAGRLLSGFGACVGMALSGPTMADIYRAKDRGRSLAIAQFAPFLGAAIGPILGSYISASIGWPWIFWTVSCFDAFLVVLSIFLIHESYAPVLLACKAAAMRKATGLNYETAFERQHPTLKAKFKVSMLRPLKLLATRPVIHVVSVLTAYNFGVYILVLSSFATVWTGKYNYSVSSSGLHYISITLGSITASQVGGRLTDKIWARLKAKAGGATRPEYRVPLMFPSALMMPIGLIWFGWAAEHHVFWLFTDIGAGVFSCGIMLSSQSLLAYLIDEFGKVAASANAAARILSNIMGFAFPLFAPQLFAALGYGWGNTLLAFVYMAMGIPAPLLLWKWGHKLRAIHWELGSKAV